MDEERKKKFLEMVEEYKKKKEQERREHPERFEPKWPYELFGVECGEGWKKLYQPLIDYINNYNKDKKEGDRIEIHQIKEKFGGLRFYVNFYTEELKDMIRKAESMSYCTCERCGEYIDKPITENHWIYAECEDCHRQWKEDRQKKMDEIFEKKAVKFNLEHVHEIKPKKIRE